MDLIKRFSAFLILIVIFHSCSEPALKPEKINFNKNWQFVRLNEETLNKAKTENQGSDWSSQYNVTKTSISAKLAVPEKELKKEFGELRLAKWETVMLPHNPVIEDITITHQWQGICYYKKHFQIDGRRKNDVCYIEFEGAMQLADIWVNGKHVMQHAGGYTPFVIELTNFIKYGEENEILVRLDNRNNPLIPPGKPLEKLDFCYHGGIYRDVNLIFKNKTHITNANFVDEVAGGGIFVTYPKVSEKKAVISIKTHIANQDINNSDIRIIQKLFAINGLFADRKMGKQVATTETAGDLFANESKHFTQEMEIKEPLLWSPDNPFLYLLRTEIEKNGRLLDYEEQRIGIRKIRFTRENGFEINGQKLRLVGSNRHQEYPYVGNAISDNAQYRDIYHIKESGFNLVRLGHYLEDKSVLDACDELGVLAIEPIPGWQFFNEDEQFCDFTYRDIRQMVRRDRNHPCMIMWEVILNESWPPQWWKDKAATTAKAEYPGDQFYTSGDSYGYFGWDVQYNDWEEGFKRPNNSGKPGFIREYYDYEFGGHYSTTRIKRGDGEKALLQNAWNAQWSHNRYMAYYPWTSGDAVWSMYDYNRGCCDNICHSGVADIFRIEKFSVPFFKSQVESGSPLPSGLFKPYIFLASLWNGPISENKIVVYSNTEEVSLSVNGKEIARQKPDNGPDTEYASKKEMWYKGGNSFDGGNCKQLGHPPFTFNNIVWQSGEITAIGYINNTEVCRHIVHTPGQSAKLAISYFESGKPATKNDLLIVYVNVEDENSILCISDLSVISLSVLKGGKVLGPSEIKAEAGIASFLVRTNDDDELVLKAGSVFNEMDKVIPLSR
jgi:beta-galactosidase